MSLLDNPFWLVVKSSFSAAIWKEIFPSTVDTLYMTLIASLIMLVGGLLLGLLLTVTNPDGLIPVKIPYHAIGWFANVLRSLPEMIMIILMLPLARLIFGHSYGSNSCIIAISASCIPMFGRLVESSLLEIDKGKIEAAKSIGSSNRQIIFEILIPETLPSLIRNYTSAIITIVSMTALAGNFGAGGIGDIAVRYGYQRFMHDKLFACIYVLVILVMTIQGSGNLISKGILRKRHLV